MRSPWVCDAMGAVRIRMLMGSLAAETWRAAPFKPLAVGEGLAVAPIARGGSSYERAVRALVTKGVKRGEFAPCDPALVTRAMLGAVNWTARWYRSDGSQSVTQIAKSLSEYLVRGVVCAPSSARSKTQAKSC